MDVVPYMHIDFTIEPCLDSQADVKGETNSSDRSVLDRHAYLLYLMHLPYVA